MGEIWVCAKKKEAFFCKKKLLIISSSLKQEWMRYSKRRPHNDKPNVVRCVYKISLSPCSKSKWVSIEKCWLFHVSGLQSIWMLHIHWPLSQVFNCFLMRLSQQLITWQQVSIFRYVDKVKARLLKFKWVLSIRKGRWFQWFSTIIQNQFHYFRECWSKCWCQGSQKNG